ncbi:hypothetical protein ACF08N_37755 [Streptomyces sp. NPDC015127]|uniref:hypothetical protein n=1 Tax=Streptomyces sp. NPDC015127 TaxID=3364939 RepID=UPI0036F88381
MWLDGQVCRFAATGHDADDLSRRRGGCWTFPLATSGFEWGADPAFFAVLRDATAGTLAWLWITSYLLSPVPADA